MSFHIALASYLFIRSFKTATMEALQRRMIEEDMVQYKLFLIQPGSSSSQQTEERLTHLVEEILAKVAPLLIQYIWQHQPINLKYHPEKGRAFSAPQKGSSMLYVFTWLTLGTHTLTAGVYGSHSQEAFLLTLVEALSLETMLRTSGLSFISCCKSRRLSLSLQQGKGDPDHSF